MNKVLSQSLSLPCGTLIPNRLAKSAMSEQLATIKNQPSEELVRLYTCWAAGGSGLLISGNVMIDRSTLGEARNVVVEDESDFAILSRWASAGKANNTQFWMQINHPGRQSPRFLSSVPVAPSAIPVKVGGMFATPRALTEKEIERLIERYAATAAIAKKAGFTGVQIHGAHGYLVNQFLSPLSNQRDDAWGGTPKKRMRFVLAVARAMRKAVGMRFPVAIKLNSADFQRGGFTEEESMDVVRALADEGLDLLEISGGTYESQAMTGTTRQQRESTRQREAYFLSYAEKVRKLVKLPLMLTGGFRTATAMTEAITSGAIDIVGMARPLALEPDLPARILNGEAEASKAVFRLIGIKALDGVIDLMWHTQQLHRIGAGKEPDPTRSPWTVMAVALLEGSWDAFCRKRA
ncbi:MAG: NADH:flavin oxidoreductase/NADH oxidase family protein [Acidobacteriota bacterium]